MTEKDIEQLKTLVLDELETLDPRLTYHSAAHTRDVYEQAVRIADAEGVSAEEIRLLKLAALFHDTGFLRTYAQHEMMSCRIFREKTAGYALTVQERELIEGLIMATCLPQEPQTHLQQIICDADLDYLGRDDFFVIGDSLRREFRQFGIVDSDQAWEALQLKFLNGHRYHTANSRELREPVKQQHLRKLRGEA